MREPADRLSADRRGADHGPSRLDRGDQPGVGSGVKDALAQRLAKLPAFHPSSTAEAARAARRAGDQSDQRDGADRGDRARPDGTGTRPDSARRDDRTGSSDGANGQDGAGRQDGKAGGYGQADRPGSVGQDDGANGQGEAGRQDGKASGYGQADRPGDGQADQPGSVGPDYGGDGQGEAGRQDGQGVGLGDAARWGDQAERHGDQGQDAALRGDQEAVPEAVGDTGADQPVADYWDKVEGFEKLWEQHVESWPDHPAGGDRDWSRPGDPPGSWRGEGDRYLSPEQNAEADHLIAALRAPEREVTEILQAIEQDNTHGARLAGLEHRLKGTQRLKEKIVDAMTSEVASSLDEAVMEVSDAVRYTFCIDWDDYVQGYHNICERLESAGYQMTYARNRWIDDPHYKGVNTRWAARIGDRFELQFHTEESLHAKEHLTHKAYDRLRALDTTRAEQRELKIFQTVVSESVPKPSGVASIQDRKKMPR